MNLKLPTAQKLIYMNTVYKKRVNRLFESRENASKAKINITEFLITYNYMWAENKGNYVLLSNK